MADKNIGTGHLAWKILRLTEKAITLLESGRVDDAMAVVDNRERALNIIVSRQDITSAEATILQEVDKLNERLLSRFVEAREQIQRDLSTTHKQGNAHRAYHSNQVK